MRRVLKVLLVSAAVALIWAPLDARADGYVSPWIGTQFGSNWNNGRAGFGADVGYMGAGIIGGELDFGYSPSFFGTTNDFGHNTVINLMGNLIVGAPIGVTHGMSGIRPYATVGIGMLRTQIDGGTLARVSSSNTGWGWDAGVGLMGYFNEHVGLRGDVRYLRGFQNPSTGNAIIDLNGPPIHFWRIGAGVILR